MNPVKASATGAVHLVRALAAQGVERIFCVPGESYLAVLDALYDARGIDLVTCRQEGGAAMMAEADAKLTGRPGICMVTRGPGATNASAGIHVAAQDSTPMIVFVGQVARGALEREAFQEIDYVQVFAKQAKWVASIDSPARVSEFVARAFAVAMAGRPGPVVLALPEDMLVETAESATPARVEPFEIFPSEGQMARIGEMLADARKPVMVVGGSRWDEASRAAVERFASRWDLPAIASFRRQDRFDNAHPCYVGEIGVGMNPRLRARVAEADLVLLLGGRMGEMPSDGYTLLSVPTPAQRLVHVHADSAELGKVYQPELAINATPAGFAALLEPLAPASEIPWKEWRDAGRADYMQWQRPTQVPGAFNLGEVVAGLNDILPGNAIVTNGAGNFAGWVHRFFRYGALPAQLAPTSGSMGYGVPAAVAAKLRFPERTVVCFAGDGDFLMTGQELATAVQYGVAAVFVIVDNGMYGTIRMHQERHYPGRPKGTDLRNPDFAALARAYGAHGERVEDTAAFLPAFERALATGGPAVIHVVTDPEALTPSASLSEIRAAAS